MTKNTQENKKMALQELGELYRRSLESGGRGFGKSGIKWMVSEFKGNEISTRYDDIFKKINTDNDIYQWPASDLAKQSTTAEGSMRLLIFASRNRETSTLTSLRNAFLSLHAMGGLKSSLFFERRV